MTRVRIDGDVVHRPAQRWTPAVHHLLEHLHASGVDGVPRPLGLDGGVETVTFLPGAGGSDCWPAQATDEGLRSAARLLRRLHDATRGWEPPADADWVAAPGSPVEVVCHGDPGPWNVVWEGNRAVGLIDWDLARPGPALDDVAYALEYFTPFRSDAEALRWHGFSAPPDRPHRMRTFIEAYGLEGPVDLVDAVVHRQSRTVELVEALAAEGIEPQRTWVQDGFLEVLRERVLWSRANTSLFSP